MNSDARKFFCASQDFRSETPTVRLTAITDLLRFAKYASPPIRSRAATVLEHEFGPYVLTHGMPVCAAPIAEVLSCEAEPRDCRECPWMWSRCGEQEEDKVLEAV